MKEKIKRQNGITLIALVVTIIILLILAGVAINVAVGDNGLFSKSKDAVEKHKISAAREKLELTLADAAFEKETNPAYTTQDDFLDKLILDRIDNSEIIGNVVIVDGYMFEIDRSVPKIGQYVGPKGNIKYPDVSATVTPSEDGKSASINITAQEDENGISKIEVIINGKVVETYDCSGSKEKISKTYKAMQNGSYTIKAYSKTTKSEVAEVNQIIMSAKYEPDGSSEWKKAYSVKVSVEEGTDKIANIKYKWLTDVTGIDENSFTNAETCSNGQTIEFAIDSNGEPTPELTGTYYLWTMITTESGKTNVGRSKAFYFDNKGPEITASSSGESDNSIKFTATVTKDEGCGKIKLYRVIVDGETKKTVETDEMSQEITVDGINFGEHNCTVEVEDMLGNKTSYDIKGATKKFEWNKYSYTTNTGFSEEKTEVAGSTDQPLVLEVER